MQRIPRAGAGDTTLLIDCGNGVFSKLREAIDYVAVDHVVLSHLHADHFLDLVPYSYALTYAPRQQPVPIPPWRTAPRPSGQAGAPMPPQGARDAFRRVVGAWGNDDLIENAFGLRSTSRPSRSRRRPAGALPARAALPADVRRRGGLDAQCRRPLDLGANCAPSRSSSHSRPARPADHRGDAAGPGAVGHARPPHAVRGRRPRLPRRRETAGPHPLRRRAGRRLGVRGGGEGLRRADRSRARRCDLRRLAPPGYRFPGADADHTGMASPLPALDGVRLLSHRPSVLFKVEHHATEPVEGDVAVEGVVLSGPGWGEALKALLAALSHAERACLFAVRLDDPLGLPLGGKPEVIGLERSTPSSIPTSACSPSSSTRTARKAPSSHSTTSPPAALRCAAWTPSSQTSPSST